MIYTLVKNPKAAKEEMSSGGLTAVTDGYIQGSEVNQAVLRQMRAGDTLIVENVLFLGKSINETVNKLRMISECKINLCLTEENLSFKAGRIPEIASALVIASKLHRKLISLTTKKALKTIKSQGKKLGHPFGVSLTKKLDNHKTEIKEQLSCGVTKAEIAKKYNVCWKTVSNFVKQNPDLLLGE